MDGIRPVLSVRAVLRKAVEPRDAEPEKKKLESEKNGQRRETPA